MRRWPHRIWAGTGACAVVLFACGLVFADLLGSSNYPPLDASAARIRTYFLHNAVEVRALAFFHVLSALALLCFVAHLHWRMRGESNRALVWAGGVTAGVFLLVSALAYRTLAVPAIAGDPAVSHALFVVSYLAGGPAIAAPLALAILAAGVLARRGGPLPRWMRRLGAVAALLSLVSVGTLLAPLDNRSVLYGVLLLAAILSLLWVLLASLLLAIEPPAGQDQAAPRPREYWDDPLVWWLWDVEAERLAAE